MVGCEEFFEMLHLVYNADPVTPTTVSFGIGFVARHGEIVGTCVKFLLSNAQAKLVHLDTKTTASLIRTLTPLCAKPEYTAAALTDDTIASPTLSDAEIGTVTTETAVLSYQLLSFDESVTIRFSLRNEREINVPLSHACARAWLAQMDAHITTLSAIATSRGSLH